MEHVHFRMMTSGDDKGLVVGVLPGVPYGPKTNYAYVSGEGETGYNLDVVFRNSRPATPKEYTPLLEEMNRDFAECMAINSNAAKKLAERLNISLYAPWVEYPRKYQQDIYIPESPVDSGQ